ncbi:break repair meiotic recombinase recruitment factor 1 [Erinaceus europaeus]|uniref:Break repair meiotic recombinase recruitment factor 1 n=1 Tax=Erinaceus europaeus TaxID=9365 RepID=A0A1S3WN85_ERIEU|nr:break repair meiotic recombinase recruitment factor 1 [Erinaceus europaeus]
MEESPACNSASRQPSRSRPLQCAPNDVDKGLPEPEQRTPEEPPLSLGNPGGHPGEAGKEDEPPSHLSGDPPVSPSVRPEISQPESGGAPDLQMGLGAPQMQDAGPQGAVCTPHLPPASPEIKSANISPLSLEPELLHLILSPGTPAPPPDTPPRETGSGQGPPDAPTDWQEPPLDVADMAALWGGSPGQELDFPPDSPMGDAPEGPASETPSEQMPAEGRWGSPTQEQPPTQVRRSPRVEDPVLEDASDIVRGLVVELSNLNRLIMSSQRDLEAFRRLSSRRGSFT